MATGTMAGSHYARELTGVEKREEQGNERKRERERKRMKEVVGRRRRTAMVVEQGRIALFRQRLPLRAIKLHFSSRQENLTLE